jgi:hypothetical protein
VKRAILYDDDGQPTGNGDMIMFTYGIPPVRVVAPVVERSGRLYALTTGHTPPECNLRSLRRYVGNWYKMEGAK